MINCGLYHPCLSNILTETLIWVIITNWNILQQILFFIQKIILISPWIIQIPKSTLCKHSAAFAEFLIWIFRPWPWEFSILFTFSHKTGILENLAFVFLIKRLESILPISFFIKNPKRGWLINKDYMLIINLNSLNINHAFRFVIRFHSLFH